MRVDPPDAPMAVTVLGSGGPMVNPTRASSGCIVWFDGRPRVLVDAGGGTFTRLGQAGIDPAGIDLVLLTHTSTTRAAGWTVSEGTSSASMPNPSKLWRWLQAPSRPNSSSQKRRQPGCWSRPAGPITVSGRSRPCNQAAKTTGASPPLWSMWDEGQGGLTVLSAPVAHGMMPAVAYRLDFAGRSIAFSGDLEGGDPQLIKLASGSDVVVHDQALPRRDSEHGDLHPPPEVTGRTADAIGTRTLLITHLMPAISPELAEVEARIRRHYRGQLVVAEDLLTVTVDGEVIRGR